MKQIINILENKYEFNIEELIKNEESTDGNVYLIKTNNNKMIMKIYNDLYHVKSITKLHKYLSNNMNIPKIIQTKDKRDYIKYNNKYLVLYTFLKGDKVKDYLHNEELMKKIAREIRELHKLTQGKNIFNKAKCIL